MVNHSLPRRQLTTHNFISVACVRVSPKGCSVRLQIIPRRLTGRFHPHKIDFMDVKKDVKTAGRTLSLFEAFYHRKTPMTLTQLANALDAPISSCHGLVHTLSSRGYLYTSEQTRSIYPTKRLSKIAREIAGHDPILENVGPILTALRDATVETVLLGRRMNDGVLYLEAFEGSHTVHYSARSSDIKPLHSSAIGKALLGRLDPAALADTLSRLDMARYTPHTNRRQGSAAGRFAVQPAARRICYPWQKCRRRHGNCDNHHGQRQSPRRRPGGSSRPHRKGRSCSHGTFSGSAGSARRRGRLTRIW